MMIFISSINLWIMCSLHIIIGLRKKVINYLSLMEAEEALRSEAMAAASKVLRSKTVVAASGFLRAETVDAAAIGSLRAETVASASGVPVMVCSKSKELHVCARCLSPAKTRCSRCKSVRYWYIFSVWFQIHFLKNVLD